LDFGSGSGKFLYQNKSFFKDCAGVEVVPECVSFARRHLGVRVEPDIMRINELISLASFWHSLEHISPEETGEILDAIYKRSSPDIRVVVCVPNIDSLQYAFFREDFAYYDPDSHLQQFSSKSLDNMLWKYGFSKERSFFSLAHSVFGFLQGFMNKFNTAHNYFYYRKKRGIKPAKRAMGGFFLNAYNYLLAAIFLLPSMLFSIYDRVVQIKGGVITVCYKKRV